jgi:hypothetical protein
MLLGKSKVQADGFGMTDVQVAIRFRGKTGDNDGVFAGPQIFLRDLADKIEGFGGGGFGDRVGHGGKPYPSSEKRPAAKGKCACTLRPMVSYGVRWPSSAFVRTGGIPTKTKVTDQGGVKFVL